MMTPYQSFLPLVVGCAFDIDEGNELSMVTYLVLMHSFSKQRQ